MSATDGNEIYVWQVQEPTGDWSMVGAMIPPDAGPGLPTAVHTVLIHRDRTVAEQLRPLAQMHAADTGQPLRLARFTVTEVLEGRGR